MADLSIPYHAFFSDLLDDRLMAVPMHMASNGQTEHGTPVPLFAARLGNFMQGSQPQQYMVSSDGQRFLINTPTSEKGVAPITVILNWQAELKARGSMK